MLKYDTLDHLKRELSIVDPHNSTDPYYSIVEKICKMVTEKMPTEAAQRMLVKTAHRILSGKPLSPIVNTPTIWELVDECSGEDYPMTFVCKRCLSLYKTVYGIDEHTGIEKASYFDIDRVEIVDDTISYNTFLENIIIGFVHEYCPIEFPYYPFNKIKVFANIFGWNNPAYKNGSILGIHSLVSENSIIHIHRFFKEDATSIIKKFTPVDTIPNEAQQYFYNCWKGYNFDI